MVVDNTVLFSELVISLYKCHMMLSIGKTIKSSTTTGKHECGFRDAGISAASISAAMYIIC